MEIEHERFPTTLTLSASGTDLLPCFLSVVLPQYRLLCFSCHLLCLYNYDDGQDMVCLSDGLDMLANLGRTRIQVDDNDVSVENDVDKVIKKKKEEKKNGNSFAVPQTSLKYRS